MRCYHGPVEVVEMGLPLREESSSGACCENLDMACWRIRMAMDSFQRIAKGAGKKVPREKCRKTF